MYVWGQGCESWPINLPRGVQSSAKDSMVGMLAKEIWLSARPLRIYLKEKEEPAAR